MNTVYSAIKRKTNLKIPSFVFAFVVIQGLCGHAQAELITVLDEKASGNQQRYATQVQTNDLINIGESTLTSVSVSNYTPGDSASSPGSPDFILNNGAHGADTPPDTGKAAFDSDGTFSVTYNLNTTLKPAGYSLTSIDTFTAHKDNRAAQKFEVLVDYVGGGEDWVSLGTFQSATPGGSNQAHHMQLASAAGINPPPFATGVAAIRFDISIMSGQNADVWREIDVTGVPTPQPLAPSIYSITPGDTQLSVYFSAPVDDGGSTITNYKYSVDNGVSFTPVSPASTNSPILISGLQNSTNYMVRIQSVNANGDSEPSDVMQGKTITMPSPPSITSITAGKGTLYNGALLVAFTAPVSNGDATITNYKYSTDNGTNFTARSPASVAGPIVISGLVTGTAYTVKILAVNAAGDSAPSTGVQATPVIVLFTALDEKGSGNQQAYASQVSTNDLINYDQITLASVSVSGYTPGDSASLPGSPDFILNNGAHGADTPPDTGKATFDSDGTFSVAYYLNTTLKQAGYNLTSIDTFTAHKDNRASQKYEVFVDYVGGGENWISLGTFQSDGPNNGPTQQAHHLHLANATNPDVDPFATGVAAIRFNIMKISNADTWREIDVKGVPTPVAALTIDSIAPGDTKLLVHFSAPVAEEGSAITNYKYSTDNGVSFTPVSPASTASPILISGLQNGTPYTVQIRGVNAEGDGTPSDAVQGTPALVSMVLDEKSSGNQQAYAGQVSSTDLINNGQPTLTDVSVSGYTPWTPGSSPGAPDFILNNGLHGGDTWQALSMSNNAACDNADGTFSVMYTLNTTLKPLGYSLTSIDTFTANQDNRASQKFEVFVDYVTAGTNWVSLGTFQSAGPGDGNTHQAHHIHLASVAGANPPPFAVGVAAIRFDIMKIQDPDAWREIDVKGMPTVPRGTLILIN